MNGRTWPHLCLHVRQKTYRLSIVSSRPQSHTRQHRHQSDVLPPVNLVITSLEGKSPIIPLTYSIKHRVLHEMYDRNKFSLDCIFDRTRPKMSLVDTQSGQDEVDFIQLDSFSLICQHLGPIVSLELTPLDSAISTCTFNWFRNMKKWYKCYWIILSRNMCTYSWSQSSCLFKSQSDKLAPL